MEPYQWKNSEKFWPSTNENFSLSHNIMRKVVDDWSNCFRWWWDDFKILIFDFKKHPLTNEKWIPNNMNYNELFLSFSEIVQKVLKSANVDKNYKIQ